MHAPLPLARGLDAGAAVPFSSSPRAGSQPYRRRRRLYKLRIVVCTVIPLSVDCHDPKSNEEVLFMILPVNVCCCCWETEAERGVA